MRVRDLKKWRKSLNMTQNEAAKALGYHRVSYVTLENGAPQQKVRKVTALACSAIAAGLKEWGSRK